MADFNKIPVLKNEHWVGVTKGKPSHLEPDAHGKALQCANDSTAESIKRQQNQKLPHVLNGDILKSEKFDRPTVGENGFREMVRALVQGDTGGREKGFVYIKVKKFHLSIVTVTACPAGGTTS